MHAHSAQHSKESENVKPALAWHGSMEHGFLDERMGRLSRSVRILDREYPLWRYPTKKRVISMAGAVHMVPEVDDEPAIGAAGTLGDTPRGSCVRNVAERYKFQRHAQTVSRGVVAKLSKSRDISIELDGRVTEMHHNDRGSAKSGADVETFLA